jgi:inorganic pyrophosphatase
MSNINRVSKGGEKNRAGVGSLYLLDRVGAGEKPPGSINVVVEIPKGGSVKYEVDPRTGLVFVDRFLYTSTHYPFNYGFVPETKGEDGDYLDALVITEEPLYPMTVVRSRTIGALLMEDEGGPDAKIIAVPDEGIDPAYSSLGDVRQLPSFTLKQLEHFFTHYKEPEPGKYVRVLGWQRKQVAEEVVRRAIAAFREG